MCEDLLSKHHSVNTKSLVLSSRLVSHPVVSDICTFSSGSVDVGSVYLRDAVSEDRVSLDASSTFSVLLCFCPAGWGRWRQVACRIWFAIIFTCVVCSKRCKTPGNAGTILHCLLNVALRPSTWFWSLLRSEEESFFLQHPVNSSSVRLWQVNVFIKTVTL